MKSTGGGSDGTAPRLVRETSNGRTCSRLKVIYAQLIYKHDGATLDHLHVAVAALEKIAPTARRVFGGAHPTTIWVEAALENARAALCVRRACSLLSGPLVFAFAVAAFAWVWRKYRS